MNTLPLLDPSSFPPLAPPPGSPPPCQTPTPTDFALADLNPHQKAKQLLIKYGEYDRYGKPLFFKISPRRISVHPANRGTVYTQGQGCRSLLRSLATDGFLSAEANKSPPVMRERYLHEVGASRGQKRAGVAPQYPCSSLPPYNCLLYTSPSPRDATLSRMPSSA